MIPLMKMRMARPAALVDINFIPGLNGIHNSNGELRFGALARHAEIENSAVASAIPILHDCAAGIADVQVRNQGTIGGSLAEADPSGDWGTRMRGLFWAAWGSRPFARRKGKRRYAGKRLMRKIFARPWKRREPWLIRKATCAARQITSGC